MCHLLMLMVVMMEAQLLRAKHLLSKEEHTQQMYDHHILHAEVGHTKSRSIVRVRMMMMVLLMV